MWDLGTLFVVPLPLDQVHASQMSFYFKYIDLEVNLLFFDSVFPLPFNQPTNPHPCLQGVCVDSKLYLGFGRRRRAKVEQNKSLHTDIRHAFSFSFWKRFFKKNFKHWFIKNIALKLKGNWKKWEDYFHYRDRIF